MSCCLFTLQSASVDTIIGIVGAGSRGCRATTATVVTSHLETDPNTSRVLGTFVRRFVRDYRRRSVEKRQHFSGVRRFVLFQLPVNARGPVLRTTFDRRRAPLTLWWRSPRGGGETEAGGQGLRRAGHHADPVDVPRRKLSPPRRPSEVFLVALRGEIYSLDHESDNLDTLKNTSRTTCE